MANKMLGKVVAGAALGGASLLVFTPGIAFADGHHHDDEGKVYAKPHVVKAGDEVKLLEVCEEPQKHAYVWSKVTGKVKLKPADDRGGDRGDWRGGEEDSYDREHGKDDKGKDKDDHGKDDKGKDHNGKDDHGKDKDDHGKPQPPYNGGQPAGQGGGAADGKDEDDRDWKGYEHGQDGEGGRDHKGYDENDRDRDHKGYDENDREGRDEHGRDDRDDRDHKGRDGRDDRDDRDHKGRDGRDDRDDRDHKGRDGRDDRDDRDHKGRDDRDDRDDRDKDKDKDRWEHKRDFVYYGEAKVDKDAKPGRYKLEGSCGDGELIVFPRGGVDGGDGGASTGTDRGLAAGGASLIGAAALGGIVLMRRRRTDESFV
ncbi:hypothetical protein NCC78_04970 [Micromonospora phytophila]|uniref:hypothetical protein n=1 Tax=Micromonospora phytophila TaxID=709888 RepID=UPI00203024D5|nr:hypothetical protein [Micromonospora phytophila]MCM0674054.1 hypothetical protein [Micromonospora phytophila]